MSEPNSLDVFISYAREDYERVRPLADTLLSDGYSVWWDITLVGGDSWRDEIERNLDRAQCVLVVWTRNSVGSRWVRAEADMGWKASKLIPVRMGPCRTPLPFNELHEIDLEAWAGSADSKDYRRLAASVAAMLTRRERAPAPAVPNKTAPKPTSPWCGGTTVRDRLLAGDDDEVPAPALADVGSARRGEATILACDIVGYARMLGDDQGGTLSALEAFRRELFDTMVTRCGGRVFKVIGDGILSEFHSSEDAVRCALAIQAQTKHRTFGPQKTPLSFRMAVHVGEVIVDGEDLYGDAVNIAARIETLCEPGRLCVSEVVYNKIKDTMQLNYVDIGAQTIRNMAAPFRVFRVEVYEGARPSLNRNEAILMTVLRPKGRFRDIKLIAKRTEEWAIAYVLPLVRNFRGTRLVAEGPAFAARFSATRDAVECAIAINTRAAVDLRERGLSNMNVGIAIAERPDRSPPSEPDPGVAMASAILAISPDQDVVISGAVLAQVRDAFSHVSSLGRHLLRAGESVELFRVDHTRYA